MAEDDGWTVGRGSVYGGMGREPGGETGVIEQIMGKKQSRLIDTKEQKALHFDSVYLDKHQLQFTNSNTYTANNSLLI